ncbi:MAG: HD domain-containing protein [candidate division KSB1 bacterium]|nr:HD domain-containing protein [candidate division KSB1 bacterium]
MSKAGKTVSGLDQDLLLTGAMLHDIGKMKEYDCKGFIDYSDDGRLIGHIMLGYGFVKSYIDKIDGFPETLKRELLHLLISHQGKREKGSPVEPMMREAFVLYYADELDSKLGAFDRIYKREYEKGKSWSSYVKLLNRFLYFGDDK